MQVQESGIETETEYTTPNDCSYYSHSKFKDSILTIGCVGRFAAAAFARYILSSSFHKPYLY